MPRVSWSSWLHSIPSSPPAEGQRHGDAGRPGRRGQIAPGGVGVRETCRAVGSSHPHQPGATQEKVGPATPTRHASSERPEPHPRQRCHGSGRALVFLRESSQVRRDLAEGATGCPIDRKAAGSTPDPHTSRRFTGSHSLWVTSAETSVCSCPYESISRSTRREIESSSRSGTGRRMKAVCRSPDSTRGHARTSSRALAKRTAGGPQQPLFDKTWKLHDVERVN